MAWKPRTKDVLREAENAQAAGEVLKALRDAHPNRERAGSHLEWTEMQNAKEPTRKVDHRH